MPQTKPDYEQQIEDLYDLLDKPKDQLTRSEQKRVDRFDAEMARIEALLLEQKAMERERKAMEREQKAMERLKEEDRIKSRQLDEDKAARLFKERQMQNSLNFSITNDALVGRNVTAVAVSQVIITPSELQNAANILAPLKQQIDQLRTLSDDDIKRETGKNLPGSEFLVQYRFIKLFDILKGLFPHLNVVDTSTKSELQSLNQGRAKAGLTAFTPGLPVWPNAVLFGEFKSSIASSSLYLTAVGQLFDRFHLTKKHQPERETLFGFVAGAAELQIWKQSGGDVFHSERFDFAFDIFSPGLMNLVALFRRSTLELGHIVHCKIVDFQPSYIGFPKLTNFEPIQISSPKSKIFSATQQDGQHYIIKVHSNSSALDREKQYLGKLQDHGIVHVPKLLVEAHVTLSSKNFTPIKAIVLQPYAELFNINSHHFDEIVSAFIDIVSTLHDVHSKIGLLYTDISPGNMMLYEGHEGKKHGLLIDWEGVFDVNNKDINQSIVTTTLFTSLRRTRSAISGHAHTFVVLDVIEAIFYVFLYITSDNRLPWQHCGKTLRAMESLKFTSIFGRFKVLLQNVWTPFRQVALEFRDLLFESSTEGIICRNVEFADVITLLTKSLTDTQSGTHTLLDHDKLKDVQELVKVFDIHLELLTADMMDTA